MIKARFIKDVSAGFQGEARLFLGDDDRFLVVSSNSSGMFFAVNETMVFAADPYGNVTDWMDLGVAYPAGEWVEALEDAGYVLVDA